MNFFGGDASNFCEGPLFCYKTLMIAVVRNNPTKNAYRAYYLWLRQRGQIRANPASPNEEIDQNKAAPKLVVLAAPENGAQRSLIGRIVTSMGLRSDEVLTKHPDDADGCDTRVGTQVLHFGTVKESDELPEGEIGSPVTHLYHPRELLNDASLKRPVWEKLQQIMRKIHDE
jgi:hypothetical protein